MGTTTQPIKFPVDKVWIYNGKISKSTPSPSGTLIDLASNRKINRSIATNKTYNYKLNDNIIKTNGCSGNLNSYINFRANDTGFIIICDNGFPPIP